ncbi:YcxB family protein [Methylocystis parvus]|uniref:YcxB family protein n=1 Tax=Methylocystis parvus TaxID=134 RepID=A0A6B8M2U5_9HYPH|nr:YcxB family protein [Methylocystis parvus]QGM98144.1 YcxB family protein [Methylocystis parvus]WBK01534.1 YcxB family protein [Methylocystis parvus OBBP]
MRERFSFSIRFDDADMRAAVNAFVWRALFLEKPLGAVLPLALLVLSCVGLAYSGDAEDAALLFFGAAALLAIFVGAGWRMQQRMMREKVEQARGHLSSARLFDEGVVIDAGGAAPLLPWKSIKAVWPGDRVWLLIVATNHFIALPVERAPKAALDFLAAQVEAAQAA